MAEDIEKAIGALKSATPKVSKPLNKKLRKIIRELTTIHKTLTVEWEGNLLKEEVERKPEVHEVARLMLENVGCRSFTSTDANMLAKSLKKGEG